MEYKHLKVETSGMITTVTLDRPKSLNALNVRLIEEIHRVFDGSVPAETRAVILTGSGEKAFAAGADISEIAELDAREGMEFARRGHAAFSLIERSHIPVIAAVNGYALGGGCELAMACHIRIASENARLGLPEVGLGLIPGYAGTQRLPRIVGNGNAMRLILTGDAVDAAEALRIGLVSEVVPQAELMDRALKIAGKITAKGPLAISAAITAVNAGYEGGVSGSDREIELFGELIQSNDAREGTSAFMEKRKAEFKGA